VAIDGFGEGIKGAGRERNDRIALVVRKVFDMGRIGVLLLDG
jgi:hypothetical protein